MLHLCGRTTQLRLVLWIICTGSFCLYVNADVRIPIETVQLWASAFGGEIYSLSTKYSGSLHLQKEFRTMEAKIKVEEVDGSVLVQKFAEEVEQMLVKKEKSVKRLADAVEEADMNYQYNSSIKYDYYNAELVNTKDPSGNYVELGGEIVLEENEHFNGLSVNTSLSDIQVPAYVYNQDPDLLNGVYMTEALDQTFISNVQSDPSLSWQYFGSSTGFLRLYPGIKWTPEENGEVAFDCRNRNWYVQAATSPKDLVIVVDNSGSMTGLRMSIAKHTVTTILDTLGENDFVNVLAYGNDVLYLEPCFNGTLVQANGDNREHFRLLVGELQTNGKGNVSAAMEESFRILSEVASTGHGSLCNQAIMLITDGAMVNFQSVFQELNWPDQKVRVFTYLTGREGVFADTVKWIACNNKGYYSQLSTVSDAQENVLHYLRILSQPLALNRVHHTIWTGAYMNSMLSNTQAADPLLVTTVARPVFSKNKERLSHLLGVVGADVPVKKLMKLLPRHKLGVHGYTFLTTNNGHVLSHPNFQPLYREREELKLKPNYNSVDLADVEWEDTEENLRTAMVKGETGSQSMDVTATLEDGKRILFLKNYYFYTTINKSPFSVGIVLTKGDRGNIFFGNASVEDGLQDLLRQDVSSSLDLANEWTYCKTDLGPHHRSLTQLQAVTHFLSGQDSDLECDEELLGQVLFDAVATAPVDAYWSVLVNLSSSEGVEGLRAAFLGTRTGLTRITSYAGETHVAKRFLSQSDQEHIFTLDHFPLWYRRSAEHRPGSFLYYIANEGRPDSEVVIASTAITVTANGKTAIAAVIGVQMTLGLLENKFWTATRQPNGTDCSQVDGLCPLSCDSVDLSCYLMDDNGFILVSGETEEAGRFFGEVDSAVMSQLLNMGIFKRVSLLDNQALCGRSSQEASNAQPLLSPFSGLISTLKCFLTNLLIFLVQFNFCHLWHSDHVVDANIHERTDTRTSCDTEYPVFVHDPSVNVTQNYIQCEDCQKMFVLQQVANSNLLILVIHGDPDCTCQNAPINLEAKEVQYNTTAPCDRMRPLRIHRRPEFCHTFHPEENAEDCGGVSELSGSAALLLSSLTWPIALI